LFDKAIIGVDIGGTKIMAGAITPGGIPIGRPHKLPTGGGDAKEAALGRIFETISGVIRDNRLTPDNTAGIGIGCTGPVDTKNGLILECPQLPSLNYFNLKKPVEEKFALPVTLNNDANALILGESVWGAGKGYNSVLGFTLGTGFGCAIVLNGRLIMGANETAGEIWTSPFNDGIIEDAVSGPGISRIYEKITGICLNGEFIAEAARNGKKEALAAYGEFGKALGFAAAWSVNLIDPEVIILGGSVSNSIDLFISPMEETIKKFTCPAPAANLKIVKAELGDFAGVAGAASLVFNSLS
jgi:glucokinase